MQIFVRSWKSYSENKRRIILEKRGESLAFRYVVYLRLLISRNYLPYGECIVRREGEKMPEHNVKLKTDRRDPMDVATELTKSLIESSCITNADQAGEAFAKLYDIAVSKMYPQQ